jgi:hypothetical protein
MNSFILAPLVGTIPLITGMIYYSKRVFGTAWMRTAGLSEEKMKEGNRIALFLFAYLFSVMLSFIMPAVVVHQSHLFSIFVNAQGSIPKDSEEYNTLAQLLEKYGNRYRWFGHGALHGGIMAVFFALPIVGINALFEKRGWKYIFIHAGFWFINLVLMGGIVCALFEAKLD